MDQTEIQASVERARSRRGEFAWVYGDPSAKYVKVFPGEYNTHVEFVSEYEEPLPSPWGQSYCSENTDPEYWLKRKITWDENGVITNPPSNTQATMV